MQDELRAEITRLRRINAVSLTLLVVGTLAAFTNVATSRVPKFDEIDVGRINVREPDGTLRLTISNKARLPEVVIGGKSYPLRGGTGTGSAGLIFFNDRGDEDGGLVYQGADAGNGYHASAHLTFDQYNQDETVALSYTDVSGKRRAGLAISDRSNVPIQMFAESAMTVMNVRDTAERARRMAALRSNAAALGGTGATRLFVGKQVDQSAVVSLADPSGTPRLRLSVDSAGVARIEFLDAAGKVTSVFPR